MRHVVFSEGKNDVAFVQAVLAQAGPTYDVDEFIAEKYVAEEGGGPMVPPETEEIRRFRVREDRGNVLLKSENGDENLLKVFARLLADLCEFGLRFTLVIDCDGAGLDKVLERLGGHLDSRYSGGVSVTRESTTDLAPEATLATCSVEGGGGLDDEFALVAFGQDLEAAAGIDRENDRDTKEATIAEYVRERDGFEDFAALFEHAAET